MTQEDIIKGCKEGNRQCQRWLVQKYAPALLAVCQRYIKTSGQAYDVLQESLILIFNKIHLFRNEGSFEGWMRTITVNTALQWLRKYQHSTHFHILDIDSNFVESTQIIPDIFSTINIDDIHSVLEQLPESLYLIFNLYVVEGYSHKDIADQLGITESTSRAALSKARARLIKICESCNQLSDLFQVNLSNSKHN